MNTAGSSLIFEAEAAPFIEQGKVEVMNMSSIPRPWALQRMIASSGNEFPSSGILILQIEKQHSIPTHIKLCLLEIFFKRLRHSFSKLLVLTASASL